MLTEKNVKQFNESDLKYPMTKYPMKNDKFMTPNYS